MGTSLLIVLGAVIGTILVFVFIGLYIYGKIRKIIPREEAQEIGRLFKEGVMSDQEAYGTKKTIMGMTNILEPQIKRDFSEFNINRLFKEVEEGITSYLTALTNETVDKMNSEKMILMKETIRQEIENLKGSGIHKEYKDIGFSQHVLKDYRKSKGTATIVTQSQVNFIYDSNIPKEKKFKNLRKETIFTCKFVYITDEQKYNNNAITTKCPNCGASHTAFDGGNCRYCGTYVKPANILKIWKITDIKEEHR